MFSHFTLGSNNMDRSRSFYQSALAPLGFEHRGENEFLMKFISGQDDFPHLFICTPYDNLPATWSNGFHLAFNAGNSDQVDAFYQAVMDAGGIDEGKPGLRPHYG